MFVLHPSEIINHMCPQEVFIWFCWYLFAIHIRDVPKTAEPMKVAPVYSSSNNTGCAHLPPETAHCPFLAFHRLTF